MPDALLVTALVATALAVWLAWPPAVRSSPWFARGTRGVGVAAGMAASLAAGFSVGGVLSWRVTVLGLLAAAAGGVAHRLVAARRRRLMAALTRGRVLEVCEQLASELGAGQPPGQALERAGRDWTPLAPVVEAFRVGADVPSAFRRLAEQDGARDLRLLAAAWQVSHRTGHGLAGAVDQVAADIRAAHATQRIVDGELASARATARLVAVLPVVALGMGSGAGGDPWGFLLGEPLGLACLGLGLAFGAVGLAWIEGIAARVGAAV